MATDITPTPSLGNFDLPFINKPDVLPFFGLSKIGYLQTLCNRYGDFKVARGWKNSEGDIIWSKHYSVMECWESEDGLKFLSQVNNRGGLKNEIRIDLDAPKDYTPERIRNWFDILCNILDELNIPYMGFHSGSRGYHIHMWGHIELLSTEVKSRFYGLGLGDSLKINESSMLTLEWAENNKTGLLKSPIRGDFSIDLDK